MKKIFKVLLSLAIIGGIAFGAYSIFNNGTNNKEIYSRVYSLNSLESENVNIYQTTNETLNNMVDLINSKNYNLPEVLTYFETYKSFLQNNNEIKLFIENGRVYINNVNSNPYFKNMNSAYKKLEKMYEDGYAYLKNTHLAITNHENYNKDYIENFYNIFNGALAELNAFYVNAGIAMVYGTNNMMSYNNKYKLEVEYYCILLNYYNQKYFEESKTEVAEVEEPATQAFDYAAFISDKNAKLNAQSTEINSIKFENYINNYESYDNLINNKKLDKQLIVEKYLAGEMQEYLSSIVDENQKALTENYLTLVIEG